MEEIIKPFPIETFPDFLLYIVIAFIVFIIIIIAYFVAKALK